MNRLVGEFDFGYQASWENADLEGCILSWFDYWLKGEHNDIMNQPPVKIFVMGENIWRDEQEWPLTRTCYTKYLPSWARSG